MLVDQTNLQLSKFSGPQPSPEVCRGSCRWLCYVCLDTLCAFQTLCNKTSIRNSLPYENNFHKTSIKQIPKYVYLYPKPWGKWEWFSWMSFWVLKSWTIDQGQRNAPRRGGTGRPASPCPLDGYLCSIKNTWDHQNLLPELVKCWLKCCLFLFLSAFYKKTVRCFFGNSRQDANGLIFLGQKPLASQQVPCSFLTGSSWSTPCVSDSVNGTSLFKYTVRNKEPLQLQALGFGAINRKELIGGFHQDKYEPSAMSHIVLPIAVEAWLGRHTRRQEVNVGHWSSTNWRHLDQLTAGSFSMICLDCSRWFELIDWFTHTIKSTSSSQKVLKWVQNVYLSWKTIKTPHDGSTGEWESAPRMVSELGLLRNRFRWGGVLAKWEGPAGCPRHSFMNFEFRNMEIGTQASLRFYLEFVLGYFLSSFT